MATGGTRLNSRNLWVNKPGTNPYAGAVTPAPDPGPDPDPSGGWSLSGTISDGSIVTLDKNDGAGFGTKLHAYPILFDTVDEQWLNGVSLDLYAGYSEDQGIPTVNEIPIDANATWLNRETAAFTYKTDVTYGNRAASYGATGKNSGFNRYPRDWNNLAVDPEVLYATWRVYASEFASNAGDKSAKFFRIWDGPDTGDPPLAIRASWTSSQFTVDYKEAGQPSAQVYASSGTDTALEIGWNTFELLMDVAGQFVKTWFNGSLHHSLTNVQYESQPTAYSGKLWPRLWGHDDDQSTPPNMFAGAWPTVRNADLWIDDTPMRVEVGNADTYAACTIKEPQRATVWNDGQLKFALNQGRLGTLAGNWVYIIDGSNSPIDSSGLVLQ